MWPRRPVIASCTWNRGVAELDRKDGAQPGDAIEHGWPPGMQISLGSVRPRTCHCQHVGRTADMKGPQSLRGLHVGGSLQDLTAEPLLCLRGIDRPPWQCEPPAAQSHCGYEERQSCCNGGKSDPARDAPTASEPTGVDRLPSHAPRVVGRKLLRGEGGASLVLGHHAQAHVSQQGPEVQPARVPAMRIPVPDGVCKELHGLGPTVLCLFQV
mmetsp:Transcript_65454/g.147576  ORF Transcript_65454/g.147576 Transcript_65454/m.147576 type:complete len:212 (-) Transcript_65454:1111-1746(-)